MFAKPWVRAVVGTTALLLIPPMVRLLGLPEDYGRAQTSRSPALVDLLCQPDDGGGAAVRCASDVAEEIRRGTRRDDWWVLGYFLLGSIGALFLTSVREGRSRRLGVLAAGLLATGGTFDLFENAQLRHSLAALSRVEMFATKDAAIAAVGGHPNATVTLGICKAACMVAALGVVLWSLRRPRPWLSR